jgi:hypothetical protein
VRVATSPADLDLGGCFVTLHGGEGMVRTELQREAFLEHGTGRRGLWGADFHVVPVRLAEVSIDLQRDGQTVALWKHLVRFDDPTRSMLSLLADTDAGQIRFVRTLWVGYEGQPDRRLGTFSLLIAFGWGAIATLYVGLQVRRARAR